MYRYITAWREMGRLRRPCYLLIPRHALLRLYLGILVQAALWCLLPTPFLLYTLPVGLIILWQLAAYLRLWRGFLYTRWPPILGFAAVAAAVLLGRPPIYRLFSRLLVAIRYLFIP